ncbi:hypothetical protein FQZ97_431740 [compost metagenome]
MDLGDARHGRHHRNRRLPAARDHVHVWRILLLEIDCRNDIRPDRRGREVDHLHAFTLQDLVVARVRACGCSIEDDIDITETLESK